MEAIYSGVLASVAASVGKVNHYYITNSIE